MTATPSALDDLDFMNALLNIVIPPSASGDLPGAGTLALTAAVAVGVRADPLLASFVEMGAQAIREAALSQQPGGLPGMTPEAGTKLVESQLAAHPLLILGLGRHLYPAYYQHPLVLAGIGEPPRPPFPEGYEIEATDPELLERLQARQMS